MRVQLDLVVGARPNVIKLASVLAALSRHTERVSVRVVHTGQHADSVMAHPLGPTYEHIQLRVDPGPRDTRTGAMLAAYERLLLEGERPHGVVVFGDVDSTLAAARAAAKLKIPIAHVEAGLRSFDPSMPEELNRILTDALSALLLTTEASARDNLLAEGRPADAIHFVGNVMIDTLVSELPAARALQLPRAMGLSEREFAYVTLHRPRNVDNPDRLRAFVDVLLRLSERLPVVFVVHPRTGKQLAAGNLYGAFEGGAAIHLLEPQPYQRNLALLSAARLILTDSGGVQEEAAYLGIPCLTLRPNTERPVTLEGGLNQLVPHAPQGVLDAVERVLAAPLPEVRQIPGWDGQAGERVANVLLAAWAL